MMYRDGNGNRFWFNKSGDLHRVSGPAVEIHNGTKFWYVNGKPHREDGPAVEKNDGAKVWWLEDIEYTEEEYKKKVIEYVRDR